MSEHQPTAFEPTNSALEGFSASLHDLAESNRLLADEVKGTRRDTRWNRYLSIVITAGVIALGVNAYYAVRARHHLTNNSDAQTQTLKAVQQTLDLAESVTSPQAAATQAAKSAVLVECSVLRSFADLYHVANPNLVYVIHTAECPDIRIDTAGVH